jgi:uncharacterized protein YuzB (UPF0349 family)
MIWHYLDATLDLTLIEYDCQDHVALISKAKYAAFYGCCQMAAPPLIPSINIG